MRLSLFYFGAEVDDTPSADAYELLLQGARKANDAGFEAVWTPERHFSAQGGLYPSPAITSAAVAACTSRIDVRAGSVVLPLRNPLLVAEEWALVDNLSQGRTGVSFASGWRTADFVLAPDAYTDRREILLRGIATVRRLWSGEALELTDGSGQLVPTRIRPRPLQAELPIWLTSVGHEDTARLAGEVGAGLLTHLNYQSADDLSRRLATYRASWNRTSGHAAPHVTVMLHTYVGASDVEAAEAAAEPLRVYLGTSLDLRVEESTVRRGRPVQVSDEQRAGLLAHAAQRFIRSASLIGGVNTCIATIRRLQAMGVDELACLVDFGIPTSDALHGIDRLADIADAVAH